MFGVDFCDVKMKSTYCLKFFTNVFMVESKVSSRHQILIVKILRERAVICRGCFLFHYNFRIGQKIFIFAHILQVTYFTNTRRTKSASWLYKMSWIVKEQRNLAREKKASKQKSPPCQPDIATTHFPKSIVFMHISSR